MVESLLGLAPDAVSLNAPVGGARGPDGRAERGSTERIELLGLPHSEDEAEEAVLEGERAAALGEALGELSARERAVLRARYGLDGSDPETQKKTAERLGLSAERVRQIRLAAEKRLRSKEELRPTG